MTVSDQKSPNKWENYGIRGEVCNIVEDYLLKRTQRVPIDEVFKDPWKISYGVTQGSILVPILYFLDINSLWKIGSYTEFYLWKKIYYISNKMEHLFIM